MALTSNPTLSMMNSLSGASFRNSSTRNVSFQPGVASAIQQGSTAPRPDMQGATFIESTMKPISSQGHSLSVWSSNSVAVSTALATNLPTANPASSDPSFNDPIENIKVLDSTKPTAGEKVSADSALGKLMEVASSNPFLMLSLAGKH